MIMWQDIVVLGIVFSALAYAVFSIIKTLKAKSSGSCSDDCSCSAKKDIHKSLGAVKGNPHFHKKTDGLSVIRD
jgi:hypothetical protein